MQFKWWWVLMPVLFMAAWAGVCFWQGEGESGKSAVEQEGLVAAESDAKSEGAENIVSGATKPYSFDAREFKKVGKSGLFLSAQHARRLYDLDSAASLLKQFSGKEDAPKIAVRYTYITLAMAGKIDEAAAFALADLQESKKDYLPLILVVADYAKKGQYKKALAIADSLPLKGAQKYFNVLVKAWLLVGDGKPQAALKKLDEIAKVKAFEGPFLFHKGLISDLTGDYKSAEKYYVELIGEGGKNASIRAVQVMISFYRRSGQEQKAKELLAMYKKHPERPASVGDDFLYPSDPAAPVDSAAKGLGEALLGMATNFMNEREGKDTALLLLKTVSYLDEGNVTVRVLLAEVLEEKKMFKEAIAEYQKLPVGTQMYAAGLIKQADLFLKLGDYKSAKKALLNAKKDDPANPAIAMGLAGIFYEQKDYKKALSYYDEALEQLPKNSPITAAALGYRGDVYSNLGKDDLAEKDYIASLKINPESPEILNALGYTWLEQGKNFNEAKAMIAKAVEKAPDNGFIIDSFGWAFYLSGDYAKAVSMLELALELEPANAVINDHLGDAYFKSGRVREAGYQWQKALKQSKDIKPEEAKAIRRKIAVGLDVYEKEKAEESGAKSGTKASKKKDEKDL